MNQLIQIRSDDEVQVIEGEVICNACYLKSVQLSNAKGESTPQLDAEDQDDDEDTVDLEPIPEGLPDPVVPLANLEDDSPESIQKSTTTSSTTTSTSPEEGLRSPLITRSNIENCIIVILVSCVLFLMFY